MNTITRRQCLQYAAASALPLAFGVSPAHAADAYPSSRARMTAWLDARGRQAATLYSWSPERDRTADSPHDWRLIPHHLRERFGR